MYRGKYTAQKKKPELKLNIRQLRVPLVLVALLLLTLLGAGLLHRQENSKIEGRWRYEQQNAEFLFDGRGKGSFHQPDLDLTFSYRVRGNSLQIMYDRSDVATGSYTYYLNGTRLRLIGGEGTNGGNFYLSRVG